MKVGAVHSDVLQKVQDVFQQIFKMDAAPFSKVWDQAVAAKRIQWTPKIPLTEDILHSIESALRETLVYHGKGCQMKPKSGSNPHVHGLIGYLLGKDKFSSKWLDSTILKAIFVAKNPEILRCMREELNNIFEECSKHLPLLGSPEEVLFQTFVGNCVALLPFSYPEAGETFSIPQKVDGMWKICKYTVDPPIELTPKGLLTPMFAFGLSSKMGPPLLTITGTTFPAGDGFLACILSDFTPGMSVGHAAYLMGKEKIGKWLEGKSQVRLFGMSLGGALCFHVLGKHREKIAQVDVYNPAGLYPWDWEKPFDRQKVNIYYQENDLVATMGMFPTGSGVSVYRIFGPKTENCLNAHARGYAGASETTIVKSSPEYENSRFIRQFLTAVHCICTLTVGTLAIVSIALLSCMGARKIWG
jgi:hypothetical protein